MPNENKALTYIKLSDQARRLAKMAAASNGVSLSSYVERLINADAQRSGLADLVAANKEVDR